MSEKRPQRPYSEGRRKPTCRPQYAVYPSGSQNGEGIRYIPMTLNTYTHVQYEDAEKEMKRLYGIV